MDFSLFGPLLALREELAKAADLGTPLDKKAIGLLKRVAQQRERTLALIARAQPESRIDEVFRAAAAPLPALPVESVQQILAPKAKRAAKGAKTAKTAGTAKKAKKPKKAKETKATKATKATK